jgi:hypothetical protein
MKPSRHLLAATLLALTLPQAQAALVAPAKAEASALPPTVAEVRFYIQPLVRARLRLPNSLHDFVVTSVAPTAQDPARFLVEVQFKAQTPFGAVTQHAARFWMKHASTPTAWILTAE